MVESALAERLAEVDRQMHGGRPPPPDGGLDPPTLRPVEDLIAFSASDA